jgi:DNA invertase Pin-like site-specific DNA recombinase
VTPHSGQFVAYYRVSTKRQGASGLGLEAQKAAVQRYLDGGKWTLRAEFTEVESGKDDKNRPQLQEALGECDLTGATLIISRLDRLSRDVEFLAKLQKSSVKFKAVDMPEATHLTVHIMAAMAQHEREAISKRTKEALAVAKAKGIKLGAPRVTKAFRQASEKGWRKSVAVRREKADTFATRLDPILKKWQAEAKTKGITLTQEKIAHALNKRGIRTPRGMVGKWTQARVSRVLSRLQRSQDSAGGSES